MRVRPVDLLDDARRGLFRIHVEDRRGGMMGPREGGHPADHCGYQPRDSAPRYPRGVPRLVASIISTPTRTVRALGAPACRASRGQRATGCACDRHHSLLLLTRII